MAKVETFIEVTLKMNLGEARDVMDSLNRDGKRETSPIWLALAVELKKVEGIK